MFTVMDRSNYLKGLLILARQDKRLAHQEKDYIRDVAKKFGFSKDFYEDVLKSLMANKYLTDEPVVFSTREIAESFLKEGFEMAYCDEDFDPAELDFLKNIAAANEIEESEFVRLVMDFNATKSGSGKE
jgi:uncharacterized tellurite resistance protein B-like protein